MKKLTYVIMLLIFATSVMAQTTIKVCQEAGPGCDYTSISEAVAAAPEGATILVEPGWYVEESQTVAGHGNSGLKFGYSQWAAQHNTPAIPTHFSNKNLTLKSTAGASQTVIDVSGLPFGVQIYNLIGELTIEGFTFYGYSNSAIMNPGLYHGIGSDDKLRIIDNIIINEIGLLETYGIGINVSKFNSIIKGNTVKGSKLNDPVYGAVGIMLYLNSNILVENNYVEGCDIGIANQGSQKLGHKQKSNNNIFRNNIVENCIVGIGNYFHVSNTVFEGNTIANNTYSFIEDHDHRNPNTGNAFDGIGKGIPVNTVLEQNNIYGGYISGAVNASPEAPGNIIPEDYKVRTICNYWGHPTGPEHPTLNPTGLAPELESNHWTIEGWSAQKWTANSGSCDGDLFWVTENTSTSALLNWDKTKITKGNTAETFANAQSFIVHLRRKNTNEIWRQGQSVTQSRKFFNLDPNTLYEVRILFYANANFTGYLGFKSGFEFYTEGINIEKIQDFGQAFLVQWEDIVSANSYVVQRRAEGQIAWSSFSPTQNNHVRMFGLTEGSDYNVRVLAYNDNSYIGVTEEKTFTTNVINSQVTNITSNQATIQFQAKKSPTEVVPIGANRYIIHYRVKDSENPWTHVNVISNQNALLVQRTLINLSANTQYEYRILAYFNDVYGGATTIREFTTAGGKKADFVTENNSVVSVYPNPFVDVLNIEMEADADRDITYTIIDVTGKIVKTGTNNLVAGYNTIAVNVAELPQGIYVVNFDNQSFTVTK